jgi:hypothetical protein
VSPETTPTTPARDGERDKGREEGAVVQFETTPTTTTTTRKGRRKREGQLTTAKPVPLENIYMYLRKSRRQKKKMAEEGISYDKQREKTNSDR